MAGTPIFAFILLQLHGVSLVLASLLLLGFTDVLVGFCALSTLLLLMFLMLLMSLETILG
jgi:hypothetical protein